LKKIPSYNHRQASVHLSAGLPSVDLRSEERWKTF